MARGSDEAVERLWAYRRARAHMFRPRVSWCRLTRRYVLCLDGRRHECSRSWKSDQAFRYLGDAIDEGRRHVADRLKWLAENYGQPPE